MYFTDAYQNMFILHYSLRTTDQFSLYSILLISTIYSPVILSND